MRIDLDINGDKAAAARLKEIGDRAVNVKPVLTQIGEVMREGLAKQWETGGAHLGGKGSPWPKLAKATIERKAREGLNREVLRATGALESSLKGGAIFSVASSQVRVGTKDFRARFHQGGTKQGMPARKLVGVAKADRQGIFRLLRRHLTV